MIVINGEPFIRYNLESLYPHAHEIIVVEGAVERYRHAATPDGHSRDRTVEIIKKFPDPEGKIKLVQRNGFWPEKDDMANAYLQCCSGDYVWQVDVDEFYRAEDIEKVRSILEFNTDISRVDIKSVIFWRSFSAVIQGASLVYGADNFRRIYRFRPGYRYITHRPPTMQDETGQELTGRVVTADELLDQHGVFMYHYSYIFPEYVKGKAEYYSKMEWGRGHEDGLDWYDEQWCTLSNPLRVHMVNYPPSWIIPFQGQHPDSILQMLKDVGYNEDADIIAFLQGAYQRYAVIGEKLKNVILDVENGKLTKTRALLSTLGTLLMPFDKKRVAANKSIINVLRRISEDRLFGN